MSTRRPKAKPSSTQEPEPNLLIRSHPPEDLVDEISTAIGTQVDVMTKKVWRSFFESSKLGGALKLYHESNFVYEFRSENDVAQYCEVHVEGTSALVR